MRIPDSFLERIKGLRMEHGILAKRPERNTDGNNIYLYIYNNKYYI